MKIVLTVTWSLDHAFQRKYAFFLFAVEPVQSEVMKRILKLSRSNAVSGDLDKILRKRMPGDGKYKWLRGDEINYIKGRPDAWLPGVGHAYKQTNPYGRYNYYVEYRAGRKDVEWFCQLDCNYLSKLERRRALTTKEPAVWALRELDRVLGKNVNNIRAWWRSYIFPNGKIYDAFALGALLDAALSIYISKLLTASLTQYLPQGSKHFERGLLNIIRGYLGLEVIKPSDERLLRPPLAHVFPNTLSLFLHKPEYYEKKDKEAKKAAEATQGGLLYP